MEDSVSRKAYTSQINSLIQSPEQPLQPSQGFSLTSEHENSDTSLAYYGFHGKQLHPLDPQSSQCSQVQS